MKIIINVGFVILLSLIGLVFLATTKSESINLWDTFSTGYMIGLLTTLGLVLLGNNIIIEKKNSRWRIYQI